MNSRSAGILLLLGMGSVLAVVLALTSNQFRHDQLESTAKSEPRSNQSQPTQSQADRDLSIVQFCGSCHRFPSPSVLPRSKWPDEILAMYDIYNNRIAPEQIPWTPFESVPSRQDVTDYFTSRSPRNLPPIPANANASPSPIKWTMARHKPSGLPPYAGVSNVKSVDLLDSKKPQVLVTDMRYGHILLMLLNPLETLVLGKVKHPAHAEIVDLNLDGHQDVLVADLGTVTPSDEKSGSIVWLKGTGQHLFYRKVLASNLGRVTDARAADFDGDGDLDVVAAVFGWRKSGRIIWLENLSTNDDDPHFIIHDIDPRPGAIHVPIHDLNDDGRPDFIALISQQFETIVAFINQGGGTFESKVIFTAPHPNWGSSGIDLVDLDNDGDQDLLYANGDSLDDRLLKPYHGISWIENKGQLNFQHHPLIKLYGAHIAKAGDFDGDGDLDIAACAFLPIIAPGTIESHRIASLVWLEQIASGDFRQHRIETGNGSHPTLDVADFDQDGDQDILVGNMTLAQNQLDQIEHWIQIWTNERITPLGR